MTHKSAGGQGVERECGRRVSRPKKKEIHYPLRNLLKKTRERFWLVERTLLNFNSPLRIITIQGERKFTPSLRGSRGSRAVCAKADSVGGKMRFIAIPGYTPHRIAFGLRPSALRLPLKGGVDISYFLDGKPSTGESIHMLMSIEKSFPCYGRGSRDRSRPVPTVSNLFPSLSARFPVPAFSGSRPRGGTIPRGRGRFWSRAR